MTARGLGLLLATGAAPPHRRRLPLFRWLAAERHDAAIAIVAGAVIGVVLRLYLAGG